jgi:hypothetical protein
VSLCRGSAAYYAAGRLPYPPELADAFARELGIDADAEMLAVAPALPNVQWRHMAAE